MTGYVSGTLTDDQGARELLTSAGRSVAVAERLGCPRLNLHGTGLDPQGLPVRPVHEVTGAMWLAAARTLERVAALGERAGATFCLEAWASGDSEQALARFRDAFTRSDASEPGGAGHDRR
jgi:hydroxypyruvate isomerase